MKVRLNKEKEKKVFLDWDKWLNFNRKIYFDCDVKESSLAVFHDWSFIKKTILYVDIVCKIYILQLEIKKFKNNSY